MFYIFIFIAFIFILLLLFDRLFRLYTVKILGYIIMVVYIIFGIFCYYVFWICIALGWLPIIAFITHPINSFREFPYPVFIFTIISLIFYITLLLYYTSSTFSNFIDKFEDFDFCDTLLGKIDFAIKEEKRRRKKNLLLKNTEDTQEETKTTTGNKTGSTIRPPISSSPSPPPNNNNKEKENTKISPPLKVITVNSHTRIIRPIQEPQNDIVTTAIGKAYEIQIGRIYARQGYTVNYYGIENGNQDLGRDVIAYKDNDVLIIQCKCWNNTYISEKVIAQLYGTTEEFKRKSKEEGFNRNVYPVLCSSADLTTTAQDFAKRLNVIVYIIPQDKKLYEELKNNNKL